RLSLPRLGASGNSVIEVLPSGPRASRTLMGKSELGPSTSLRAGPRSTWPSVFRRTSSRPIRANRISARHRGRNSNRYVSIACRPRQRGVGGAATCLDQGAEGGDRGGPRVDPLPRGFEPVGKVIAGRARQPQAASVIAVPAIEAGGLLSFLHALHFG